jgi:hypothetical protein
MTIAEHRFNRTSRTKICDSSNQNIKFESHEKKCAQVEFPNAYLLIRFNRARLMFLPLGSTKTP